MSIAARITMVDQTSYGDHVAEGWLVEVTPDQPTSWAPGGTLEATLPGAWAAGPPCAVGEAVTVPVHFVDQHLVVHRAAGDVRLKIYGSIEQPGTPLGWNGHRDEFGRDR